VIKGIGDEGIIHKHIEQWEYEESPDKFLSVRVFQRIVILEGIACDAEQERCDSDIEESDYGIGSQIQIIYPKI
jgi:hypothetical protein